MSFIQVQQSLVTHRKTLRLARLLSLDRYAVVGRLVALWAWCLDNALDGALGDDIDADILADVMGWDATQGRPSELLEALLTAGFLDFDDTSDPSHPTLRVHDWHEHMGRLIEKREADAERHRRSRAQARLTDAADVSAVGETSGGDDVMRTSRGRHADVMRQSRGEKKRVEQSITTSEVSSPSERERAHDATMAADAALTPLAPTPQAGKVPSPSSPKTATGQPAKVTPLRSARLPDPVWDACIAAMGSPPSNHVERGKWARGIVGLKESLTAALPPGVTAITAEVAAEIGVRSRRYRARFGANVPLNPMALAGNWTALASDIQEEGKHHGQHSETQRYNGRPSAAGRGGGRSDGRPAIGTPAYYAQATTAAQGSHTHGGGTSGQGVGAAAVGEW